MAEQMLMITRGLPGSGKTTIARKMVADAPGDWVRINRDDLRDMMHGGWTGKPDHEDAVTAAQHAAIHAVLTLGRSVIVDDTNLRQDVVDALLYIAADLGLTFAVLDLTPVPVDTCIARDAARIARGERGVGEHVIRDMHHRYLADTTESDHA